LLAERRDPAVIAPLRELVLESAENDLALQALWALTVSGGFDESFANRLLDHRNANVRRWTVRLLGDENRVTDETARRLNGWRPTTRVRSSAPNLPARPAGCPPRRPCRSSAGWCSATLTRPTRTSRSCSGGRGATRHRLRRPVTDLFTSADTWKTAVAREWLTSGSCAGTPQRVGRRTDDACAKLLRSAPVAERRRLLAGFDLGWQERQGGGQPSGPVAGLEETLLRGDENLPMTRC